MPHREKVVQFPNITKPLDAGEVFLLRLEIARVEQHHRRVHFHLIDACREMHDSRAILDRVRSLVC